MKSIYNLITICILISISYHFSLGQPGMGGDKRGGPEGSNFRGGNQMATGYISGSLVDSLHNPIEFASAAIYLTESFDPITGVITDEKGSFYIKNVPIGNYILEISYVGFKKVRVNNIGLSFENREIILGDIVLVSSQEMLEGITVTADKPNVDYKIDRKVVSVSQDIVAKGGSVIDALENVPSVKTDINGDVTIRGSGNFTVLIDGKPSVLKGSEALQQIPANAVANIEIITNPSARFDPDGDAGIINVIMKKKFADGISAIINGSAGTPNQYSFDISSNYVTEKGTLTAGFDFRQRDMEMGGEVYRETYLGDTTETQTSSIDGTRGRENINFKLGYERDMGKKNTLSIQGTLGKRKNNNYTITHSIFGSIPETTLDYQQSDNLTIMEGNQYNVIGTFIRNFNLNGHRLDITATLMGSDNMAMTDLVEYETDPDWNRINPSFSQLNNEESTARQIRFNADYIRPFDNDGKLETGYQSRFENTDSYFESFSSGEDGNLTGEDTSNNELKIFRNIQSIYGVYSHKIGYLGYQIGLRTEYTGRDVEQVTAGETYTIDRFDFFPSVHLSYKLISGDQLQASYSRRINRPSSRQLNPFPRYMDSRNMRIGNPFLEPEFIDSYEVNFMKQFIMSFISVEAFYKKTNNVMTLVQDINDEGTIVTTYNNLDTDKSYGLEAMASLQLFDWWRLTASTSIYQYTIQGDVSGENVDNSSLSWNGRLMSMFTIPWDIRLQINGIYNSDKASAQGRRSGFMMTNVALRKDFFNDKLGLTFQVRDIFSQMNFSYTSESDMFYTRNEFSPETPMFSLNLSLKLNNYKKSRSRYGSDADVIEMDFQNDFGY